MLFLAHKRVRSFARSISNSWIVCKYNLYLVLKVDTHYPCSRVVCIPTLNIYVEDTSNEKLPRNSSFAINCVDQKMNDCFPMRVLMNAGCLFLFLLLLAYNRNNWYKVPCRTATVYNRTMSLCPSRQTPSELRRRWRRWRCSHLRVVGPSRVLKLSITQFIKTIVICRLLWIAQFTKKRLHTVLQSVTAYTSLYTARTPSPGHVSVLSFLLSFRGRPHWPVEPPQRPVTKQSPQHNRLWHAISLGLSWHNWAHNTIIIILMSCLFCFVHESMCKSNPNLRIQIDTE